MKNCKSFYLWVEDRYGTKFFSRLLERIESKLEVTIPKRYPEGKFIKIKSARTVGNIETKIDKAVALAWKRYDCAIVVCDGDGKREERLKRLNKKVSEIKERPENKNKKVIIIVFKNAIESDWIEKGLDKKIDYRDKAELPDYANKLNLNLLKNDDNFKEFIYAVDP
ncbi:hypothetical protein BEH94_11340 [Candidatus Altiarchaeales archaeon WOR_SM1_SCG]|nr:hypothetical protein BEH94_11340 [Candidatus Altiarchaeales archaeon WOR_SM1_SCG]